MEPIFSPQLSILEPERFQNPRSRQCGGAWALHKALLNVNAVIHPFSSEVACFRTTGCRSRWGPKSFSSKNILSQQSAWSWARSFQVGDAKRRVEGKEVPTSGIFSNLAGTSHPFTGCSIYYSIHFFLFLIRFVYLP